jgi:hypothetical protein
MDDLQGLFQPVSFIEGLHNRGCGFEELQEGLEFFTTCFLFLNILQLRALNVLSTFLPLDMLVNHRAADLKIKISTS